MDCIIDLDADEEPTVVIHPTWPALTVLLEAEQHSGPEARELREDAERLAAAVPWGWATVGGAP